MTLSSEPVALVRNKHHGWTAVAAEAVNAAAVAAHILRGYWLLPAAAGADFVAGSRSRRCDVPPR